MEEQQTKIKEAPEVNEPTQSKEAIVLEEAVKSGEVDKAFGLQDDGVYKINLDKPPKEVKKEPKAKTKKAEPKVEKDAVQKQETKDSNVPIEKSEDSPSVQELDKEVRGSAKKEKETVKTEEKVLDKTNEPNTDNSVPDSPLELITEEEPKKNVKKENKEKEKETPALQEKEIKEEKKALPENVDKLVRFLEETGGTIEDYVNLNKDISKMDNISLLREYYAKTKPHLNAEDIDFLFNKNFAYDGEADDPQEIKAKTLAFKEELFNAQNYFTSNKEKYYADLKLRKQPTLTPEQNEAIEYYNNYKQQRKGIEDKKQNFLNQTEKVFNDNFKGFDFKVGENKYRYKIDNPQKVKEFQSSINNWINSHVDNDTGNIKDASIYHKSLFAAQNADKIANHFYEQGRADAIRESAKQAKNIKMDPRADNASMPKTNTSGIRAISSDDNNPNKLRIKWK